MDIKRRGGARPGAGRPKGTANRVSAISLLETIAQKTGGMPYTDLLVEDFLAARTGSDTALAHKYHSLIAAKVLADRVDIEVEDTGEAVAAKEALFAAALATLAERSADNK